MPLNVIRGIITRKYSDFRGIDLLNPETQVDPRRSPDCLNVWKSYKLAQSNIIQTRPGLVQDSNWKDENEQNNSIYSFFFYGNDKIVHVGNRLENSTQVLYSQMAENESEMVLFGEDLLILDGTNYLRYKNGVAEEVQGTMCYIPTTSISRSPSGGGEMYEDVNLLQPKRKNSFVADGTSTVYQLDAIRIDSVDEVKVNDVTIQQGYSVNTTLGKVTFTTAPAAPTLTGKDNVEITFTKTINDKTGEPLNYPERIKNCTIMKVFDNRVFFSGNPDYPNAVFHSSLNNPYYVSDLDYYECGTMENPIKSIVVGNNVLWVFKKDSQTKDTIFYMTPNLDTEYGKVYPTSQGNVAIGCINKAVNYKDNILYFSKNGLEGISGNVNYEQSVTHKSSLVDPKLTNASNYEFLKVAEFNGYLAVAIDNQMFLADYRQTFGGTTGTEFEWYVWELPVQTNYLKAYQDNLYIGDLDGKIYRVEGTNDLGEAIESYWTTPREVFGYMQHLKKINKRGAILKMKNIQNSRLKIAEKTNKATEWKLIKEVSGNGFNYGNMDYSNFTYITGDNTYVVFRIKEKKIIDIALKIYSDELNKPFGLIDLNMEAFISGYVKRS